MITEVTALRISKPFCTSCRSNLGGVLQKRTLFIQCFPRYLWSTHVYNLQPKRFQTCQSCLLRSAVVRRPTQSSPSNLAKLPRKAHFRRTTMADRDTLPHSLGFPYITYGIKTDHCEIASNPLIIISPSTTLNSAEPGAIKERSKST